jgi:hypothetical protein
MSGGQPERGKREQSIHRELDEAAEAGDSTSSDILGQIVAQTAASLSRPEEATPELKAAMLAVAREHAGQPLVVDGAGTALLEAVLRVQFSVFAGRPALLTQTARAVAGSLLADPAARLRAEHLWATLQEEAA